MVFHSPVELEEVEVEIVMSQRMRWVTRNIYGSFSISLTSSCDKSKTAKDKMEVQ